MSFSKKSSALYVAQAGIIAALYVVLTVFAAGFDLASGAVQVRISEALTVLPVFTPAAVPGLFIGCLLANLITGSAIYDVVFGSLITLAAAFVTRLLRNQKFIYTIPPVLFNALGVPVILILAYGVNSAYPFLVLTVGAGEAISVFGFGFALKKILGRYRNVLFPEKDRQRVID
ncbi:MAG: QueT transporter family protein [Lachnospiraceae bacterium]|uniref:QueT transporter family protein n=1 Tax=Candidatus Weimeria bifida TaxID=2599074 RepID=A0A6N7IWI0_9FIRM|nr:QueT transporter family protein [Candidatus Weimeria bifida]RRF96020.1 MAG: QueT transporter family protein [Lachnospiraceae bacterium]